MKIGKTFTSSLVWERGNNFETGWDHKQSKRLASGETTLSDTYQIWGRTIKTSIPPAFLVYLRGKKSQEMLSKITVQGLRTTKTKTKTKTQLIFNHKIIEFFPFPFEYVPHFLYCSVLVLFAFSPVCDLICIFSIFYWLVLRSLILPSTVLTHPTQM